MKHGNQYPQTIAIDGPAASGKSSVGKRIANNLGYMFLDTGVMYRAVTYAVIEKGIAVEDEHAVGALAEAIQVEVKKVSGTEDRKYAIFVDSINVTDQLRTTQVNRFVSQVSRYEKVRTAMTEQQKRIGRNGAIVMAGRDIGTVVLPKADLKVYLEATPQERARRRFAEEQEKGDNVSYDAILENVQMRDEIDSTREIAPLKPADDAHIINTDGKDVAQVTAEIMKIIEN